MPGRLADAPRAPAAILFEYRGDRGVTSLASMLFLFLACSTPVVPPPLVRVAEKSAFWPADPVATADACALGSKPDCSALLLANRRAWAYAVLAAADDSIRLDESRQVASWIIAAAACTAGDAFACLGPTRTPDQSPLSDAPPFTRRVTIVDGDGVPRPGVQIRVNAVGEHNSLLGYLDSDVRGQVFVPEADATIDVLTPSGLGDYHGAPHDLIVLSGHAVYGGAAARSLFAVPPEDPAWAADPVGTLVGKWKRQPRAESDRNRPAFITFHFDLPGATGGVAPMETPPKTLTFRVSGVGEDRVKMQGDVVYVEAGDGLIRVDRSLTDKSPRGSGVDLIYPADHDTFVFVTGNGRRWSWEEIYRRG